MVKSYCIRQKKVTKCVPGSERYEMTNNGRTMLKCTCAECEMTKTKFVKKVIGEGIMTDLGNVAAEAFITKGIPYVAKKSLQMGRYGLSQALRNPKFQKKAVDFALEKSRPAIDRLGHDLLMQASTAVRPKRQGGPMFTTDIEGIDYNKKGQGLSGLTPAGFLFNKANQNMKKAEKWAKTLNEWFGSGVDVHHLIDKLPRPKGGFTPLDYKYLGPYNPLDEQLEYGKDTGEILTWKVPPKNKLDEGAAYHDICYDMGKNKHDCDKKMVNFLDEIPWNDKPWGTTAVRNIINTKQKLGLGVPKNGKSRRVKKTGKKN